MTCLGRVIAMSNFKLLTLSLITFSFIFNQVNVLASSINENSLDEFHFSIPVKVWKTPTQNYRGLVIAIHGLTMHSGTYESMAKNLNNLGYLVIAPDLRGFGQWMQTHTKGSQLQSVDYEASYEDVLRVITFAQEKYPNLPTFILGESLGADIALRIAGSQKFDLKGIILSAPAIVGKAPVIASVVLSELPKVMVNPKHEINVSPFLSKYIANDENIIQGTVNDPLVRKNLTVIDLLATLKTLTSSLSYARNINKELPVLILQGSQDALVNPKGVNKLVDTLKVKDQTVKWFPSQGHLLLETNCAKAETLLALDTWVEKHNNVNYPDSIAAATLTWNDKNDINLLNKNQ